MKGPTIDRRRNQDRRQTWRGGRRDSDWVRRPPGALERLDHPAPKASAWRRWLPELTRNPQPKV